MSTKSLIGQQTAYLRRFYKDSTYNYLNLYFLPRNYINFAQNWLNTEILKSGVPNRLSKMTKICENNPQKHLLITSPHIDFLMGFQKAKKCVNKNPD